MAEAIVLFSGGWDSTLCLIKAQKSDTVDRVLPIYFNYGQRFLEPELDAACTVCRRLGLQEPDVLELHKLPQDDKGTYKARNIEMLRAAMLHAPMARIAYLGVRSPSRRLDKHGDCHDGLYKSLGAAYGIDIRLPCIALPKALIRGAVERALPGAAALVYSTER